jgi:hypothetical protein
MKERKQIAVLCFLTDVGLAIWSYLKATNYEEFLKSAKEIAGSAGPYKQVFDSPDFQVQIYQVLLQSLTFSLLLFLAFHLVIYVMFWKEKTYAQKYLRFYTFMAALSCVIMLAYKMFIGIIPLAIYALSFSAIGKLPKTLEQKQSPLQSAKLKSKNT